MSASNNIEEHNRHTKSNVTTSNNIEDLIKTNMNTPNNIEEHTQPNKSNSTKSNNIEEHTPPNKSKSSTSNNIEEHPTTNNLDIKNINNLPSNEKRNRDERKNPKKGEDKNIMKSKEETGGEKISVYEIDENKNIKLLKNSKTCVIRPLRLFYFASYEIDESKPSENEIYKFELFGQIFSQLIHSNMLNDRNAAIGVIKKIAGDKEVKYNSFYNMDTNKLVNLLILLEKKLHYVLIFSPHGRPEVNIFNLTQEEVMEKITFTRANYSVDVWYCEY